LEKELCHGTAEWDILRESFLLTFSFEDGFECIYEVIQEIKAAIFWMPKESVEWVQLYWSTQLCHALECYNVTAEEEEEEYLWNINIPEIKGQRNVEGPKAVNPDILEPLKTRKVNIGSDTQPKFTKIGDYWDEDTTNKVAELLR